MIKNNIAPKTLETIVPFTDAGKLRELLRMVAAGDAIAWGIGQDAIQRMG